MNKLKANVGCSVVLTIGLFVILTVMLFTMWTDRTLDFWLTYFSGHVVNVPMWLSALATILGNGIMLIINIISEIAKLTINL